MKLYPGTSYFTTGEFQCPCDCGFGSVEEDIDKRLIDKLNIMRTLYGKSMVVTSGARCEEYNRSVGGVEHSAHLPHHISSMCRAVDILVRNGEERMILVDLARAVGFERIGIAPNFLHFDVEEELLPTQTMFIY
jgi:uncharacterized protein YcbK (DUF882 family)